MYISVPAGYSTLLPLIKAPPTNPTGPNNTAPATEAPAAFNSLLVFSFASSP